MLFFMVVLDSMKSKAWMQSIMNAILDVVFIVAFLIQRKSTHGFELVDCEFVRVDFMVGTKSNSTACQKCL